MSRRPLLPRALRAAAFVAVFFSHGCASPPPSDFNGSPARFALPPQGLRVTTEIDERPAPTPPTLLVTGISANNEIQPEEMRITVVGAPKLDAGTSIGIVFDDKTRMSVQLANFWRHDARDNALVIPAEAVRELLERMPDRPVQVMLGLAGENGDFAYAVRFELRAARQQTPATIAEAAKGTPA